MAEGARIAGTEFLSDAWFDAFGRALAGTELPSGGSARLGFEADGTAWHVELDGGRVGSWARGAIAASDCTLRWPRDVAAQIWSGELVGNDAHRATTVVAPLPAGGGYVGVPFPMDLRSRPEMAALPHVPGASLRAQYHLRGGPFGDIDWKVSFVDGQMVADELGVHEEADVAADVSYRTFAHVVAGDQMLLETLNDGRVQGSIGALALTAGLMESPEYEAAERATGRYAIALANLGELFAAVVYEHAAQ
jgi:hypothetical protein